MKSLLLIGAGLVLVGIACNPERSLDEVLKDKSCRDGQCADGYECNANDVCVPRGSDLSAVGGMAGSASDEPSPAGAGGAPQEAATSGDPPVGGAGGAAGSELSAGGAGAVSSGDPDAGCTKQVIFIDRDGDGYGSAAPGDSELGCLKPGWVQTGGDCLDVAVTAENRAADVHPGQAGFFAEGYPLPDRPGEVSFDYDCDGEEAGTGTSQAADVCPASGSCAAGNGILPGTRSGPNVNSLCGSTTIQICNQVSINTCRAEQVTRPDRVFLCH